MNRRTHADTTSFVVRALWFAGVFFVAAEVFFRTIIPASVDPMAHYESTSRLFTYRPGDAGVFRRGRFSQLSAEWQANDAGCLSASDYNSDRFENDHRILMIGDSYIEGLHVKPEERIAPQLELADPSGSTKVFAFALGARPFSEHPFVASAARRYAPHTIVCFLTPGDLHVSLTNFRRQTRNHQLSIHGPQIQEIPPDERTSLARAVSESLKPSALVRYLVWGRNYVPLVGRATNVVLDFDTNDLQLACRYTVKKLRAQNPDASIVLLVDANRRAIQSHPAVCPASVPMMPIVEDATVDLDGVSICDLTPGFYADYVQNLQPFECAVDSHWNAYAHRLASRILYRYLTEHELIPDRCPNRKLPVFRQ